MTVPWRSTPRGVELAAARFKPRSRGAAARGPAARRPTPRRPIAQPISSHLTLERAVAKRGARLPPWPPRVSSRAAFSQASSRRRRGRRTGLPRQAAASLAPAPRRGRRGRRTTHRRACSRSRAAGRGAQVAALRAPFGHDLGRPRATAGELESDNSRPAPPRARVEQVEQGGVPERRRPEHVERPRAVRGQVGGRGRHGDVQGNRLRDWPA